MKHTIYFEFNGMTFFTEPVGGTPSKNTWVIKQMNLYRDSEGEHGNYIKIETAVIPNFSYASMHEVFCLSSQRVLNWKVQVLIKSQ